MTIQKMTSLSNPKLAEQFRNSVQREWKEAQLASGDREKQRELLLKRKAEIVAKQQDWLDEHKNLLSIYYRSQDLPAHYVPERLRFVVCKKRWQHDLWRVVKLTNWSMPPNEYMGRRKRILVFDGDYLLGLIGLASCVWGLTARDEWIGWDVEDKRKRINYVLDAYVLGAVPPYNGSYRGSKLLAYAMASEELRSIWESNYGISPAVIATTTLFGHTAVLNRLKHDGRKLWINVGYTKGFGTMHYSKKTFQMARDLLDSEDIEVPDRLHSGPNWKLRLMRTAFELIDLSAKDYLRHGYNRGIYVLGLAKNAQEFLKRKSDDLNLYNNALSELKYSWKKQVFKNA